MKLKYILIIFILTITVLCFTRYRNTLFTKVMKIKEARPILEEAEMEQVIVYLLSYANIIKNKLNFFQIY